MRAGARACIRFDAAFAGKTALRWARLWLKVPRRIREARMSDDWKLALLEEAKDSARVLDCAERCRDYILMETGREPDVLWVKGFFADVPPGRTKEDILMFGVEEAGGRLKGLLGMSPGYETATEWYLGLLVLEETARGQGLGTTILRDVVTLAKSAGAETLKLAVFTQNPDALRFWQRNGFAHFRDAPGDEGEDGQDRVVLIRKL
jgi:GNAT superfamily N-acetyltransferase